MKKLSLFFITGLCFALLSCSKSDTPAAITKDIYSAFQAGNYDKGAKVMLDNMYFKDTKENPSIKDKKQTVTLYSQKAKKSFEQQKGIKTFEILQEEYNEDNTACSVSLKIIYGDDTEDTKTHNFVNKDGKWYLDMNK